jgi:cell division protein FtsI/penicillin-binding protein 2
MNRKRLYWVIGIFSLLLILIFARLIYIQLLSHGEFSQLQKKAYVRRIALPAYDGNIYDRNNNLISTEEFLYNIRIDPIFLKDLYFTERTKTYDEEKIKNEIKSLAKDLGVKFNTLYPYIINSKNQYLLLKKSVSLSFAKKIQESRPYIILQRLSIAKTLKPSWYKIPAESRIPELYLLLVRP